jgi:NTE family protein
VSSTGLRAAIASCLAVVLLAPAASLAQDKAKTRPTVGLVLGGGGARGGAHIGVLEVLEELRIPVDCVAGTSIGALVSGAFVSGLTPAEMSESIRKTDWDAIFDDSAGREYLTYRHRNIDERFYSGLEFGVTKDGLRYREGAVAGEKVKLFFAQLVRADLGERPIETLPLPLTLIATDIGTGDRVAMRSGNLISAMRASMSVPGVLAPVQREGHKLVDGGLVDNVPIQEVRDRCGAEVVIAVNVGSPLTKPENVSGVLSVVGQMVNLLTEQNVSKSLALLKPTDIYMRPELGDITAADFGKQLDAAKIGHATALGQADKLRKLSVSQAEYDAWRKKLTYKPATKPPVIDEVHVADTRYINSRDLRESIRQREGEPLDAGRLGEDVVRVYSRGDLAALDYSLISERDKTILRLVPVEKAWGPDYLRFGMNLSTDFRSQSEFNLRALYRKTWINSFGGEWLSTLQIGGEEGIATEFYQPLDYRQFWFIHPYVGTLFRDTGLYFNGDRLADIRLHTTNAGLDVGASLGNYGQAKIGWQEHDVTASIETGSPLFPSTKNSFGGIAAQLAIDQYDFAFFPTRGYKAQLDYFDAQRASNGGGKYARAEAQLGYAVTFGDVIVRAQAQGGKATRGELPFSDLFALGGLGRLSAYATNQILGQEYALGVVRAEYRLLRPIPVIGLAASAGFSYELGRMKKPVTEPTLQGTIDSYSLYFAANTPLGPMYLGYAGTSQQSRSGRFYFFLGTP